MQNKDLLLAIVFLVFSFSALAQDQETKKDSILNNNDTLKVITSSAQKTEIDPLAPSKAAFYSAVLPGLGQAYNKKYWKIPIVYAALGTGIYFYVDNNNEYKRYRDAYKSRLAGFETDEFFGVVNDDGLVEAQKQLRRNKEISLLVTIGIYALNIIDANVDAHLLQYNVDDNLSLSPHYKFNELEAASDLGLTLNFKF
ncbi:MAG: hypothetical protein KJP09_11435 [Bacteroidia bacterium]|nr:hypothetical protein [Bacteroidia bacterium]NND09997.1 hypothetical protein [Flavobacteriaceae bacterium]MBT8310861.1 hypothetical protein [Bacteroidia bacterium]NNK28099.1 hypothetical protein [Flavobacteriaceae bacterium]NNL61728.1 hypothetical protein [Flavobacteriaceae bacterium]